MKTTGFVVILVCSALLFTAAQNAANESAVTRVLALEYAWNQAAERKDTKALDAILDNSMVYVDYYGILRTKSEFLAWIKSTNLHPQQEVTQSMAAHMFGSTVVVTGVYVTKGVENGKPYVRRARFVDAWTFKDGNWLCVVSQSTPVLH
ncbi:MAG: nuclear transport factor 2 family protein [Candidatus Sulfotelmatobacter sp.]